MVNRKQAERKNRLKIELNFILLIFGIIYFNQNWQKSNFSLAVSTSTENKNIIETENLILSLIDSWPCVDSARNTLAHILMNYDAKQLKLLDFNMPEKFNIEEALKFIDAHAAQAKEHKRYIIQTKKIMTQPVVGGVFVDFYNIPCSGRQLVSLSIFVDNEFQKQGLATEALFKLIDELIENRDVEQIYWCCLAENKPSKHLAEKVFNMQKNKRPNLECEFKERVNEENQVNVFEAILTIK